MMVSDRTRRKAERLLAENRVTVLQEWDGRITVPGTGASLCRRIGIVAWVQGDRGRYLTTVLHPLLDDGKQGYPRCSCTCEAGLVGEHLCSHQIALTILLERP